MMKNIKTALSLLLLSFFIGTFVNINPIYGQGWIAERGTPDGGGDDYKIEDVTAFYNGVAYSLMTTTQSHRGYIYRTYNDYLGEGSDNTQLSSGTYYSKAIAVMSTDTLLILNEKEITGNDNRYLTVSKYSASSDIDNGIEPGVLWEEIITISGDINFRGTKIHPTADGNFIILGSVINEVDFFSNDDILLMKITPTAEVLWSHTYETELNDAGIELVETVDGGFLILKNTQLLYDPAFQEQAGVLKVDGFGNVITETNLATEASSNEGGTDISYTNDGNFIITGTQPINGGDIFLIKVDEEANLLWRQNYFMPEFVFNGNAVRQDAFGDLVVAGYAYDFETYDFDFFLLKTNAEGEFIYGKKIATTTAREKSYHLSITPDGGYLLAGFGFFFEGDIGRWVKISTEGYVKPCEIWGNVYHDLNEDCEKNDGDTNLKEWMVRAFQDSTTIYYGTTDDLGNYRIPVDSGDYVVSVLYPNDYWVACYNDSMIHLNTLDTIEIDFALQAAVNCPLMSVNIRGGSLFRPCFEAIYVVRYCNEGPVTALDAYLEVTLDPLVSYNSSGISPSLIEDNVYTFSLGDVASGECNSFKIIVTPDCDSTNLGMTLCADAHVFPDSICSPGLVDWEGAFIELDAHCDEDNLVFNIRNTGGAATVMALNYIVIEDAILLMQGNFDIESGEVEDVTVPANGSTYHLYAEQEAGAPNSLMPVLAIEGCGVNDDGTFSVGFINQLPVDNVDAYLSMTCVELVNSYDPNDKKALPSGYGEDQTIWQNVDLSYQIRFQNTGTAPAIDVVVVDTISSFLDITTLRTGASSHSYTFKVESTADVSQAIVTFTFADIYLIDSLANEPESHGFVNFKIAQKRDNPIGTIIENSAGIYFDNNPPIITNTAWHTVGEPMIDVIDGTTHVFVPNVNIKAFPNPFSESLVIEVSNLPTAAPALLKLYDVNGRMVQQLSLENGKVEISGKGLPAGIYFFQILTNEELVGTGKVMVRD